MVKSLAFLWLFQTSQPPHSALTRQALQAEFGTPANPSAGFTVRFTVRLGAVTGDRCILEAPGVFSVRVRQHDPADRGRQNYAAFAMPDGSVPVLEATVLLHSDEHPDWPEMTVGFPIAMLADPTGDHEVVLSFTGVRWTMFVDGRLVDNDFPFGYPAWDGQPSWHMDPAWVREAELHVPAIAPKRKRLLAPGAPIQYWTPPGHNTWVGDVVTCFHKGRYHVFYLFDRRHHQSKFGCGAHYFEHLSTTDFRTWTEHEAAAPLDEQWECIGTGTPFVLAGKLYLSYGLHTGRVYPDDRTTWPAQWDALRRNGRTGVFKREEAPGVPAGATYSVSADGVSDFRKTGKMIHPCQNPSIYVAPDGRLRMLANAGSKGMWEAPALDQGWRCTSPDFPPGGDCTFFFRWGTFDYIIGGFKDLWSKPADAPDTAYRDVVAQGLDFYDGVCVPAITEVASGRFLMAGWLGVRGWGGVLVLRELVQSPDGRIGAKWMKEATPRTGKAAVSADRVSDGEAFEIGGQPCMATFRVAPTEAGKGRLSLSFMGDDGQMARELTLDLASRTGRFDRELKNLAGVDRAFTVRAAAKSDAKLGGTLIDVEIAGRRTAISFVENVTVTRIKFKVDGVEVRSLRVAPIRG